MAGGIEALKPRGGEFALHGVPITDIFIPEEFSAEERLMAETAEKFCRGEVLPLQDRLDSQEDGLMLGLLQKAAELGLAGPDAPAEYGGLGLGKRVGARIQEMASLNGSFAVTIGVQSGIAQLPIALFGTPEQKATYLPKLNSGEWMGAYALSEPNYGSDALNAASRAVPSADGKHYVLNGTKMWITNAKWADLFIVFAQLEGSKLTAFIVERGFPGVGVEREEHKLGMKGSSTARVTLDDALVPVENLLYKPGKGHVVALNALNIGRFKLGAMALGPARESLRLATVYSKERKQFGRPICEFGLIRRKLARMVTDYFAGESILYRTGDLIDRALATVDPASPTLADDNARAVQEFAAECSLVKIVCSEAQAYICDEAIQIHGGYGFTEEYDVARHWRDARVSRIYEGSNEMNRLFAYARMMKGLAETDEERRSLLVQALDRQLEDPAPADPAARCTGAIRTMLLHCALHCLSNPERSADQLVLADMSDLMGKLYATETVVARAEKLRQDAAVGCVAQAAALYCAHQAYAEAMRLSRDVLLAVGSDPAKLEACVSQERIELPPLIETIAQKTLEADGYPFG
ncbi:MAG: acyl-CoA dehydrogenase [Fimbriimonadales bacterium]